MARAQTFTELEIRLFERPRKLPFRGRSVKTLTAFLRREAKRAGPWLERVADVVEALGREGWRYRGFTGKALILAHLRPVDGEEVRHYLSQRFGQEVLPQIAIRERTSEDGPPPLPKADDELSRELRRLIGAEKHKEDLYLGHPPEELSELLLDMSFLAQEALEDGEVSALLDRVREEHERDDLYRDLHSRYLSLMERTGSGDPATEEAYWDLFSYMSRKLAKLIPPLQGFLDRRGFTDLCEHEATAFLAAALYQALSIVESPDER
ncbi:MAG: hypothetical protein QN175_10065 [Armatimonadota bacterium]|nr:hypothetical protein [Armatimonadota bacterium]MDR7463512.1 hypothetical protein [Armatimonadota bacterium]MDR7469131.1 hypothetical protein [Armatimonadota bacterium]MDR7475341.1 hypothetical protein [Armatimonadota bacterium]